MWILRIGLRSACLCGKHFTDGAFLLGLSGVFFNNHVKRRGRRWEARATSASVGSKLLGPTADRRLWEYMTEGTRLLGSAMHRVTLSGTVRGGKCTSGLFKPSKARKREYEGCEKIMEICRRGSFELILRKS